MSFIKPLRIKYVGIAYYYYYYLFSEAVKRELLFWLEYLNKKLNLNIMGQNYLSHVLVSSNATKDASAANYVELNEKDFNKN